ncbi:class I SAM-dependent methyltransferase [Paenibacillus mendelii]|uniref:Class I SAM-dependent methyltransferase n=1 Tax=Paenibacillus mendelii TaxID=206163 RepID=A0ABV6JGP7_9BACL|nr:class I SAM-dependent methyltransferase [Paenibacillus mendelii]MCQ6557591.1 class I SAM-dependent methyltransferase [Paenibacillus mendelii]
MLEYTGERIIPKLIKPMNGMLLEHLARYYFATPYVKGRVLDIACGTGYGSHMTAKERKREVTEIVAVDLDSETLDYANVEYNHQKITYQQGDITDRTLPERLGTFDTILCFETIEHVADERAVMDNLYQLLKPGGILVLSSPFGRGRGIPSGEPFHVHQLTAEQFPELFVDFKEVDIYYQRGVTFEKPRDGVRYFIGIAVCVKAWE